MATKAFDYNVIDWTSYIVANAPDLLGSLTGQVDDAIDTASAYVQGYVDDLNGYVDQASAYVYQATE